MGSIASRWWKPQPTHGVRVADAFPGLANELSALLASDGRPVLAKAVRAAVIGSWCDCGDDFCQTSRSSRPHDPAADLQTLSYDTPRGMVNVDVARDRILAVEALFYPPLSRGTPRSGSSTWSSGEQGQAHLS